MSLALFAAGIYVPSSLKKRRLVVLFRATVRAFGEEAPEYEGLSFDRMLPEYAKYVRGAADRSKARGVDMSILRPRLYEAALELGGEIRRLLRVRTRDEVLAAGRLLYRMIGIGFEADAEGAVTIGSCFFSKYFSPETCAIASALDEGLAAGLSGGGTLRFTQRITEGCSHCRATLTFPGSQA